MTELEALTIVKHDTDHLPMELQRCLRQSLIVDLDRTFKDFKALESRLVQLKRAIIFLKNRSEASS